MLVVYGLSAWFLGLWLASQWSLPLPLWLLAGGGGLAAGWGGRSRPWPATLLFCLGMVALGGARTTAALPTIDAHHIAYYNDSRDITLTGVVIAEPDVGDRSVNLRLAAEEIVLADGTAVAVSGLVQARTLRFPVVAYGSRLSLAGDLEIPPAEGDFNYRDYLARQGVHSLLSLPRVTILGEGEGSPFYHAIFAFKDQARATLNQLFPDPQAALLTGILLGDDNGLPPDLAQAFRDTGMSHIIAISGFNIALLVAILVSLGEPVLGARGGAVFAVAGVLTYTVLVGADASVVRAAIMGIIYLFTQRWLGRPTFAFASLFMAGFLMTLINPFTLWDVGFQLSFMATLSLMLYADPFTRWTHRQLLRLLPRRQARQVMGIISEAVVLTLAAQVLTLPLIVGYFQQFSLASLPANTLILPVQPAVMTWGGLATLVGMVAPAAGQVLAWVAWLPLTYTILLVQAFAAVPYAAVPVAVGWGTILAGYGLIAALTWLAQQAPQKRKVWLTAVRQNLHQRAAFTASLVLLFLVWNWSSSQPDGRLHVAFLDVGQGDAIFIQTPSGRQILVDGGLYPSVLNDQLGQQMPFWDKEIDIVVATHPDADHVAGLVGVFDRYAVGRLLTDGEGPGESPVYDAVLRAAEAAETPLHRARAGEAIYIDDGVRLEILHPGETLASENRNDNSVSLRLVYGEFSLLLTGDAEEKGEAAMLAHGRALAALVFKAGHHGSRTSSSLPFLAAVRPQIIVVSSGADNRFGHPHPEVLERATAVGAAVLRTDELGTIEVTTDGQQMWWRAGPKR